MPIQLGQAAGLVYPAVHPVRSHGYEGTSDLQSTVPLSEVRVHLPADFQHGRMCTELGRDLLQLLVGFQKGVQLAPALGGFDMALVCWRQRLKHD